MTKLAAVQGKTLAKAKLGVMYLKGQGIPKDYIQAHKWFNLAAADGNKDAAGLRDYLASSMTPAQIETAQQLAAEWKPGAP
jgi:TPR repeat protein